MKVKFDNVTKTFGNRAVVDRLSLEIAEGEFGVGGMGLDLSPLIVLLVLQFFLIPVVRNLGL